MKAVGCAVGVVLALLGALFGGVVLVAGALVEQAEAVPIPPELEAAYRQVGARTGVPWAALAAWDGASGFTLPLPSVESLFMERVSERLEEKRREAEEWCLSHPSDTVRCPPEPPELSNQEEAALWRGAYAVWRQMLVSYVEGHASALWGADLFDLETVYSRFLGAEAAMRAAELFEGYGLLDSLASDADEILIMPPSEPPADWVPVDGFAWPVVAPITSRYGMRISPIDGAWRLHAGIDLGVATGVPVRASKAGTVAVAGWSDVYGLMVVVYHGGGYASLYAHNSALAVQPGQQVEQGQVLSQAGSTGWSTGPHLHFEIHYNGTPIDPLLLLSERSWGE